MTRRAAEATSYLVFGLRVEATQPLPRLNPTILSGPPDLRIHLGQSPEWAEDARPSRLRYASLDVNESGHPNVVVTERESGDLHVSYPDGTRFWLDRQGRGIWVTWDESMTIDDMSSYLLGPVMGLLLRLRGTVCLHASALTIGGHAFAIIGRSGAGKSTTAAALGARGCAVVADDVVAIKEGTGGFSATPGYPRLRLSQAAVDALSKPSSHPLSMDRAAFDGSRYHLDVTRDGYVFQTTPLPLIAVYKLEKRSREHRALSAEPVLGADALMTLVSHSFAKALFDRNMRAHDLSVLSRLAESVRVVRVTPPDDIQRLDELCDLILHDVQALARVAPQRTAHADQRRQNATAIG